MTIHATAVAFDDRAVLLRGPSGSGKSSIALRMLALPRGALSAFGVPDIGPIALVSDDRVQVTRIDQDLIAEPPPSLSGKLEVRGIGIVDVAYVCARARVALVVDLVPLSAVERMPEPLEVELLGLSIAGLHASISDHATPLKIALALSRTAGR